MDIKYAWFWCYRTSLDKYSGWFQAAQRSETDGVKPIMHICMSER